MTAQTLRTVLGPPIEVAGEETFCLFSQEIPSNNLGFVDPKASTLELDIAGRGFSIRQSTGLLNSSREEGTTGAVLWKITPLLATWMASAPSLLAHVLHHDAVVVELGCGVAGLLGLVLSRKVQCYVLTDLDYVMKHLRENLAANAVAPRMDTKVTKKKTNQKNPARDNLKTLPLDWERDSARNLETVLPEGRAIDLVVLCDCVYNEYLVSPLVQTCVDLCRLRSVTGKETVVLIAQQLRSDVVFEVFLESLMKEFDVWRVPDPDVSKDLGLGSGYAVHVAVLRDLAGTAT
ncbi:Ribosomal protein lysine methyltransferase [Cladophialophora chaetospira]|uniref:Ribosomal protein lysine methyltransferase n=1 Tax=Cladophialophora chaetospira TaxID=386627 RepID=A0AA38XIC1_9EURO|nr:Ribosomal protein lysine methyltransferase [Cladophialophora chaetospira]